VPGGAGVCDGDAGAAATELNTVFNERNDAKIGARLFMYTVGRDLNAVQASSPACTVIGGDVGKVDNERDIIDQLQGFFRLARRRSRPRRSALCAGRRRARSAVQARL
jgi:hypothetical protein